MSNTKHKHLYIIMKPKFIDLRFNKDFFAKLLLVKKEQLHYVFLVQKHLGYTSYHPAIKINGITGYVFSIDNAKFIRLKEDVHAIEKVKTVQTKTHVTFKNPNGEYTFQLADFYRQYMTRVANNDLC